MHLLHETAALYHIQTLWLAETTGLPEAILHIHAGMIIFLVTALITRQPFDHPLPLLMVVILEGGNEFLDRIQLGNWNWPDTKSDLINTIAWPLAVFVAAQALKLIMQAGSTSEGDTRREQRLVEG